MAKCLQHLRRKVLSLELASVKTRERALHCEDIRHILEFFKHCYSSCGLLRLLYAEPRVLKVEIWVHFAQDEGEDSCFSRRIFLVAPVHEDILFSRMAVQVTVKNQTALLVDLLQELLRMVDGRV